MNTNNEKRIDQIQDTCRQRNVSLKGVGQWYPWNCGNLRFRFNYKYLSFASISNHNNGFLVRFWGDTHRQIPNKTYEKFSDAVKQVETAAKRRRPR